MADKEFILPDALRAGSAQEIQTRMLAALPAGMDKSEGSVAYDFTMPTALEVAEMAGYRFEELLKSMFPAWAEGISLDRLAELRGIMRKPATYATGIVTVTAAEATLLAAGTRFSTETSYGEESVEFETVEETTVTGTQDVAVKAVYPGAQGNVAAGSITLLTMPISGVQSLRNASAAAGGVEEESDESLRARVQKYDLNQGNSYVGSLYDYERWALSVAGVGSALAIAPTTDSGQVTIVLTDTNGDPANAELCTKVHDFIMRPDSPSERLAPPNAIPVVRAPNTLVITISAQVTMQSGTSVAVVKQSLARSLKAYYKRALSDGEVRLARVNQLWMEIEGVLDVKSLTLNGGTTNIAVTNDQLPVTTESNVVMA